LWLQVQSQPYSENADVWSLGCILYELASLQAPFFAASLLHVVKRIVECDYEPLLLREEGEAEELAAAQLAAVEEEAAYQARLEIGRAHV
jgi:NIMA (never in mitosis gene a)-related kinase